VNAELSKSYLKKMVPPLGMYNALVWMDTTL
jgi:hypothetical protein